MAREAPRDEATRRGGRLARERPTGSRRTLGKTQLGNLGKTGSAADVKAKRCRTEKEEKNKKKKQAEVSLKKVFAQTWTCAMLVYSSWTLRVSWKLRNFSP